MRIGLVLNILDEEYQISLYRGIKRRAAELGIQIVCFQEGNTRFLSDDFISHFPREQYFNLDGIILLTSVMVDSCTLGTKKDLRKIWGKLPVVSVGQKIKGIPSLLIQTDDSMRELMDHLVKVHNYHKFIYIGGSKTHQDAINREQIFTRIMEQYKSEHKNLSYRILKGSFTEQSAVEAMDQYTKSKRFTKPDAVICANDNMAMGVYKFLKIKNDSKLANIAVTGFDDIPQGRYAIPSITTVHQPLDKTGEEAVNIIYDAVNGKKVPSQKSIGSSVIYRESCGCKKTDYDIDAMRQSFSKLQSSYVLSEQMLSIVSHVGRDLNNDIDEKELVAVINYYTVMLGIKDFCILKFASRIKSDSSLDNYVPMVRPVYVKYREKVLNNFPADKNGEMSLQGFYDYLTSQSQSQSHSQPQASTLVFKFLNVGNDYLGCLLYDAPEVSLPYIILLSIDIALCMNRIDANEERRRYADYLECEVTKRTHELVEANNKRMETEAQVLKISEIERQRFSNDLHDDICQRLAGISMLCKSYFNREEAVQKSEMEELAGLVSDTLQRTRQYAHNSYPVDLDTLGLDNSLNNLCNSFEQQSGIHCDYQWAIPQTVNFDRIQKLNIFRIIQEALHNVMKHSEATNVSVNCRMKAGGILVRISDNGKGMPDQNSSSYGIGINSMQYRANQIGAGFNLYNQKSGGVCVEVTMSV